jgi:Periplasmic copper-binding protein (NosD)
MFMHTTKTLVAATAAAAALAVFAGPSAGSSSMPITTCAQAVKTDAVLTQDLDCAGTGVVVGASGITIDLNGHTLKGAGGAWGIFDISGYDDVTVKDGAVRSFATGVYAVNAADRVKVSNVDASGNTNGVLIAGSSASIVSSTVSGNAGPGIYVSGDSASVKSSTASGNTNDGIEIHGASASVTATRAYGNVLDGIYLPGAAPSVKSSTSSGNGLYGFHLDNAAASITGSTASGNGAGGIFSSSDAAVVKGNRAEGNGFSGGASDGSGPGIYILGSVPADAGTNVVRGNDDPAGCIPSVLCKAAGSKVKAGSLPISSCGQTVTANAVLTTDLTCGSGNGVNVGASGITIDLNGHVLNGNNTPGYVGVYNSGGYDRVIVKNGVVRGFTHGILADNAADDLALSSVVLAGNTQQGLYLVGDNGSIKSSTADGNGDRGIWIDGDGTSITSSTAAGNAGFQGILVTGDATSVKSSAAVGNASIGLDVMGNSTAVSSTTTAGNGNTGIYIVGKAASVRNTMTSGNGGFYGIYLSGDAATLKGNAAVGNGFAGGSSDGFGLGIFAENFTTAPTGTNVARGNDDAGECNPSSLC